MLLLLIKLVLCRASVYIISLCRGRKLQGMGWGWRWRAGCRGSHALRCMRTGKKMEQAGVEWSEMEESAEAENVERIRIRNAETEEK